MNQITIEVVYICEGSFILKLPAVNYIEMGVIVMYHNKRTCICLVTIAVFVAMLIVLTSQAEVYAVDDRPDPQAVFEQWERSGYPDDIGGVYFDQRANKMVFTVIDPTSERLEELRALLGNDVIITSSNRSYSYGDVFRAYNEILTNYGVSEDSKIYSMSVTLASFAGGARGSDEGMDDERFVVSLRVDASEFDRFEAEFSERYGDMVVLARGTYQSVQITRWIPERGIKSERHWPYAHFLFVGLLVTLLVLLQRRKHHCYIQISKEYDL